MNTDAALTLLCSLLLTAAVAASGARFAPDAWYAMQRKPAGLPPRWVFPAVWTTLYVLMAIAAARVYLAPDSPARTAGLWLYALQLLTNAAWSWLFFGRHRADYALLDLLALLALLSATLIVFAAVDRLSAALLAPYWLWLWVALYLNASIWWLNRNRHDHAGAP
ncbi:TspO/MBR family protein [Acidihalobacter ferrooxydans]|uniref:Sensory protein TspO n=1 Tax=Acidihalobacter ferrooxydans TaxID=1765967 RepID=A0A1P8UG83_9GAMM|nr:TspO/MBR family protein [Acidihalobacter ferrooxydans]APZ42852.1 sensory protein TspO [Acidihalobacter ferrooxydans]